jgi:ketosteroid isomerase-like protein
MPRVIPSLFVAFALLLAGSTLAAETETDRLRQQVAETERAFAATMADRDHAAFVNFLSDEAVFFSGDSALRGKQQVADTWKAYFEEVDAPFSWEPQRVEVLDSGTLALSTGPVRNSNGELFAFFTSIWRLEANGAWKIIFDKGSRACEEPEAKN